MDEKIEYFKSVASGDEREARRRWNYDALAALAKFIRLQAQGALWDDVVIRKIISDLAEPPFDYADAIDLGNQVLSESPYPYEFGTPYLNRYDGEMPYRKGGRYANEDQKENGPITGPPSEHCLKFQTPVAGREGGIAAYSDDPQRFEGVDLNKGKWNPWLDPHEPTKSDTPTYNILKTLEYGYKDVPGGKFKGHSPHIVVCFTGHE